MHTRAQAAPIAGQSFIVPADAPQMHIMQRATYPAFTNTAATCSENVLNVRSRLRLPKAPIHKKQGHTLSGCPFRAHIGKRFHNMTACLSRRAAPPHRRAMRKFRLNRHIKRHISQAQKNSSVRYSGFISVITDVGQNFFGSGRIYVPLTPISSISRSCVSISPHGGPFFF